LIVIEVAFRALRQQRSEAFGANERVCQVDEQEQRHAAPEDEVEKHFRTFRLENVAGFDVGEGEGEEQNPYPDNNDVHRVRPMFILLCICIWQERNRGSASSLANDNRGMRFTT
jgi:hypothetical protein